MSFLSGLASGPGLTAVSNSVGAYQNAQAKEQDKQKMEALQQLAFLRQQHETELNDLKTKAQTAQANATAQLRSRVPVDPTKTHATNRDYDVAHPLPEKEGAPLATTGGFVTREGIPITGPSGKPLMPVSTAPTNIITAGIGENGKPTIFAGKSKGDVNLQDTGVGKPQTGAGSALNAPMAAKVGQAGEMLKKANDLLPAMEAMQVSLSGSAAQDIASHGVGVGSARIPGTKGVGSLLLNREPTYAQYQAAISPFILAAAHALSGARINQDQVAQIRESIELKPGDFQNPHVVEQKRKNVIDLINSITGSLPSDAMQAQEAQMDEASHARLKGYGYKSRTGEVSATTPQRRSTDKPGNVNLGGVTHAQQLWDAAVAKHGEARVIQEYGPRPNE